MDTGYGVEYTADNLPAFMPPTLSALQGAGTRFIRLTWVDLSNTVRCRVIPIRHFLRIIASKRPAISLLSAAPGLVFSFPPPGFGSAGEVVYTPDEASLRPAAYAPGHASMFGWFESKDGERGPSSLCPRGLLKKILEYVNGPLPSTLADFP
jgi:glutamine synthetase